MEEQISFDENNKQNSSSLRMQSLRGGSNTHHVPTQKFLLSPHLFHFTTGDRIIIKNHTNLCWFGEQLMLLCRLFGIVILFYLFSLLIWHIWCSKVKFNLTQNNAAGLWFSRQPSFPGPFSCSAWSSSTHGNIHLAFLWYIACQRGTTGRTVGPRVM